MKKVFFLFLVMLSLYASAQKNNLLDRPFWKGNTDLVSIKAEIAKGSDPTESNSKLMDAATFAIATNAPLETILYLLSLPGNGSNKTTHDQRPYISWAAASGNIPVMQYLLDNGAKINVFDRRGYSPVIYALRTGQKNIQVYKLLIDNGFDIKNDVEPSGANPLLVGLINDVDFKLTDYFISQGLNINSKDTAGNTAFNYAAQGGNIETMRKLIQKGIPFTDNAMIMAAQGTDVIGGSRTNSLEVFKYLEKLKINLNTLGANGENVLFYMASKPNQEETLSYFIAKGVDVNLADRDGNTPFLNAAKNNKVLSTLVLLVKYVKNINLKNFKGATALSLASKNNTAEVVQFLVDQGAVK